MPPNAVPLPPNPFPDDLHTITLPKGSELHRIYSPAFAGNAFNPTHAKLNRFSPIFDARGEVVSVLYAASSRAGAIYETLFHDAAVKGSRHKALPLKTLHKHYGTWVTQRSLTLATLRAPDLGTLWGDDRPADRDKRHVLSPDGSLGRSHPPVAWPY